MSTISIHLPTIAQPVKQHLAVIGKHHRTPSGETVFTSVTLSEIESTLLPSFVKTAAQVLLAELSPILASYTLNDLGYLTFTTSNARWGDVVPEVFVSAVQSYLVASSVQSALNLSLPDIAPKYAADTQALLNSLVRMAFTKTPPGVSTSTLTDCTGSCTLSAPPSKDP